EGGGGMADAVPRLRKPNAPFLTLSKQRTLAAVVVSVGEGGWWRRLEMEDDDGAMEMVMRMMYRL
ncbi:hypothetical protein Tco_1395695, partial [Tanacetum coccineum]